MLLKTLKNRCCIQLSPIPHKFILPHQSVVLKCCGKLSYYIGQLLLIIWYVLIYSFSMHWKLFKKTKRFWTLLTLASTITGINVHVIRREILMIFYTFQLKYILRFLLACQWVKTSSRGTSRVNEKQNSLIPVFINSQSLSFVSLNVTAFLNSLSGARKQS